MTQGVDNADLSHLTDTVSELRRYRQAKPSLKRGKIPSLNDESEVGGLAMAATFAFFSAVFGAVVCGAYQRSFEAIFLGGKIGALLAFMSYAAWPALAWVSNALRNRRWPAPLFLSRFPVGQKLFCVFLLTWPFVVGVNHGYPQTKPYWQPAVTSLASFTSHLLFLTQHEKLHPTPQLEHLQNRHRSSLHLDRLSQPREGSVYSKNENLPLHSPFAFGAVWLVFATLLAIALSSLTDRRLKKQRAQEQLEANNATGLKKPFRLWLGQSTGNLAKLSHGASVAPHQAITLSLADATQNILVLGGIGSGKTTRAMHPLLIQLLDQHCGGLIFDIKGDFQQAVLQVADHTNRPITRIGPNHQRINLLGGLTPEMAASFLKSAFLLSGKSHSDGFWVDTATELCRNALGLLSFLPKHYSLQGLYGYLFDPDYRLALDNALQERLPTLTPAAQRLLNAYWQYQERIFDNFDDKVRAGVNATVAQVLAPFTHPDLIDAFCTAAEPETVGSLEDVLQGAVYLVSLPLSVWGLGGKVVYTFIKLRFYNVMQNRSTRPDWNQTNPVFFMCDEFQEIVSANKDGLSDLNFWDKSRSSKTIGIISAQAISSFYAALGDRDTTHALLQNFRQKMCFKTEDTTTLTYFNALADKVEVIRKSYSTTTGSQKHPTNFFSSSSSSTTENISFIDKPVLDAQLFRKLTPDQALALLSIEGHSMDDVIQVMSVYF
jgi:hypothetical protein